MNGHKLLGRAALTGGLLATTASVALAAPPPTRVYKDSSYNNPYYCYEWRDAPGYPGYRDCHFRWLDDYGRTCAAWVYFSPSDYARGYWEGTHDSYREEYCA